MKIYLNYIATARSIYGNICRAWDLLRFGLGFMKAGAVRAWVVSFFSYLRSLVLMPPKIFRSLRRSRSNASTPQLISNNADLAGTAYLQWKHLKRMGLILRLSRQFKGSLANSLYPYKRKDNLSSAILNPFPVLILIASIGLPVWFTAHQISRASMASSSIPTPPAILIPPTSTPSPILLPTYTPYPTYTVQPSATPLPSLTPTPTLWPISSGVYNISGYAPGSLPVVYSRYYPDLLGANCHPDNVLDNGHCRDITSSGLPWSLWLYGTRSDNYRGGVAVPLDWGLGYDIRVLSPPEIAGLYYVIDYCPACANYRLTHGVDFLDFLDASQTLDYWAPLIIEIVR